MNGLFIVAILVVGVLGVVVLSASGEYGKWASFVTLSIWTLIALVFVVWGICNHFTGTLLFPWKAGGAAVAGLQIMAGGIFLLVPAAVLSIKEFRQIKRKANNTSEDIVAKRAESSR
jgi:hypothetical protein